jgi:hypothetical protein
MTSRHEQIVEILLRQILDELRDIDRDVDEVEDDIEKLIPEPAAISATLVITPN